MRTRLLEGADCDGCCTGYTDADSAFEELCATVPDWAADIRRGLVPIDRVHEYLQALRENEITAAWRFPDGSVLRLQVGATTDDPTRVWVIEPPGDENDPEALLAKPCLLGWYPSRLPDGTWGARHDAPALLPEDLVGRRIVVEGRNNRTWTSQVLDVVDAEIDFVLVRSANGYRRVTDAKRQAAVDRAAEQEDA